MADDKNNETLLDSPHPVDEALKRALGIFELGEKKKVNIPDQPSGNAPNPTPSPNPNPSPNPKPSPNPNPAPNPTPGQGGGGNNVNMPPINVTINNSPAINPTFNNSPTFTNAPRNTNTANGGSVSGNHFSGGNANATGGQGGNVSGVSATGGQGGNATGGSANATGGAGGQGGNVSGVSASGGYSNATGGSSNATGGSATNNNKNTSSNYNINSGAYSSNQPVAATKKTTRAASKSKDQYAHEIAVAMENALLGRYSHIHLPDEEQTVFGNDYREAKEIIDELKETLTNQNPDESNYVKTLGQEAFERLKKLYTKNEIEKLKNSGKYSKGDEKKVKASATKYFNQIIKDGNYEELGKLVETIIKENYNGRASEFLRDIYGHVKGE